MLDGATAEARQLTMTRELTNRIADARNH